MPHLCALTFDFYMHTPAMKSQLTLSRKPNIQTTVKTPKMLHCFPELNHSPTSCYFHPLILALLFESHRKRYLSPPPHENLLNNSWLYSWHWNCTLQCITYPPRYCSVTPTTLPNYHPLPNTHTVPRLLRAELPRVCIRFLHNLGKLGLITTNSSAEASPRLSFCDSVRVRAGQPCRSVLPAPQGPATY